MKKSMQTHYSMYATNFPVAAALLDGILVLNGKRQILWWNKAAKNFLNIDSKSKGRLITDYLNCEAFQNYLANKKRDNACEFPAPDNPKLHLSVSLLPYKKDQQILVLRDVTHTYILEKVRRDFVANVSHELRTPLTVLRGYLESVMDNLPQEMQNWANIFNQMHQQAIRMERIIQELLMLSHLESGVPNLEEQENIDITSLLESIRDDALALSGEQQHQLSLKIGEPKYFKGNKSELRSAFSNLVYNAVNYTPAQGSIFMRWYKDKKGVHFEVKDTGLGIESKHIPRLTERFYRVDPGRTRKTGGTGLGLAIVKHVLIRHHGQLHIDSKVGRGSIFRCDFT